jgi:hypothetical protein
MKKQKCYAWAICIAAALGTTACHDDIGVNSGSAVGKIAPHIELDTQVKSSAKAAARAEWNDITVDSLTLKISSEDGKSVSSWNSISLFPTDNTFAVGNYLVEALYGSVEDEGFEKPAYYGSQSVTVREDETTDVSLTASLVNTMVSVEYSDAFKGYMTDWSAELHSTGGEYQYMAKGETRPCYLRPGTVTVNVEITKPNGKTAKLYVAEFTAEAQHHYKLTVDMNEGAGAGSAELVVKYDDTLVQEDVVIDLSDDVMNAPAPTITGDGVVNGQKFSYVEGTTPDATPKLNIIARGSIAAVTLTTQSDDLIKAGWPAEVNLASPSSSDLATLKNLGLTALGLWQNPDKMAVVDFTKVLPNTANAVFTVQVRDRYNKVSDAFAFEVSREDLNLSLEGNDALVYGSDELTLKVKYNGNIDDLKVMMLNRLATYSEATINSISDPVDGVYDVTIKVSDEAETVSLYLTSGDKKTDIVTISRSEAPITVSYEDNNIWATKATVNGTIVNAEQAGSAKLAYRKQGATSWTSLETTTNGTALSASITGLEANTTYELVALNGTKVAAAKTTFTTEAATQLPNSDMETWYRKAGDTSYWWIDYLGSSASTEWGTNNLMTTSQGGSGLNMFNHNGTSYCASSGTIYTSDAHNGEKAALIRTVGWGGSNSAVGESSAAICKYIDAGLLHLGSGRTSREDGNTSRAGSLDQTAYAAPISFSSRPSSLSFWYKYTAKNSNDHGTAEVIVYAGDQILASGTAELTAKDSYTEVKIPLTYATGATKATKIYVKFMSTYSTDFLELSTSNMSYPPSTNLSDGMYLGSQLYLDDLSLNY